MNSYQEGDRMPHFVIQVPSEKVEAVVRALEDAGVRLDPRREMIAWDSGRDYTHAGADCGPPISMGDDLANMVQPANNYLEEKGIAPLLPDPEGMDHQQFHECLTLTNNEFTWYGLELVTGERGEPERQADWDTVVGNHPSLFREDREDT